MKSINDKNIYSEGVSRLDPNSSIPLYHQLKKIIRQNIDKGVWKPYHMIPSESKFAKAFGVSPGTVRNAIEALVDECVLFRKQGKGTFVANPDFPGYLRFFRLPGQLDEGKLTSVEIMSVKNESPDDDTKRLFNLSDGEQVIALKRLKPDSNLPILIENIYLPRKSFPNFNQADFNDDPVYHIYDEKYNLPIVDAHDYYTPRTADKKVSEFLKIKLGDPVIFIKRISFTYNEKPVEYRKCYGLGDLFQLHIPLGRAWRNHLDDRYWHVRSIMSKQSFKII